MQGYFGDIIFNENCIQTLNCATGILTLLVPGGFARDV